MNDETYRDIKKEVDKLVKDGVITVPQGQDIVKRAFNKRFGVEIK